MWLYIALIGYGVLAVVNILDKFILSKEKVKPIVFVFYSAISIIPIIFLIPFGVQNLTTGNQWLAAIVSGVSFILGLYAMYVGFEESEISHVGPLVGAAIPFFVVLLARVFLKESITFGQSIAIVVLILGSLLISFEKSKLHQGWHRGMLWGLFAGLFFGISHVASKYMYGAVGFYSGLVWTRAAMGLSGVFLLTSPMVRESIFRKKIAVAKSPANKMVLIIVNKALAVVGVVLVQYAIALGSVSLVNALGGAQFAILIILVAVLSKFLPRFFKEKYARGELIQEGLAVAVIAFGLALLLV